MFAQYAETFIIRLKVEKTLRRTPRLNNCPINNWVCPVYSVCKDQFKKNKTGGIKHGMEHYQFQWRGNY